jgi:hypothetical protein
MKSPRITGVIFYSMIALWLVGVALGMTARFPYMERRYSGVTLPCFCGLLLLVLAVSNYCTGAIWRGRARSIERRIEPLAYWASIGLLGVTGAILVCLGLLNWTKLP